MRHILYGLMEIIYSEYWQITKVCLTRLTNELIVLIRHKYKHLIVDIKIIGKHCKTNAYDLYTLKNH